MGETKEVNGSVVIIRNGCTEVLMQLNNRDPQKFELPGGGIKMGETPVMGAVREVQQETGIVIPPHNLLLVGNFVFRERYGIVYLYEYQHTFTGPLPDHISNEVSKKEWMSIAEILTLSRSDTYPAQQALIAHYAQWARNGRLGVVIDYLSAPFDTLEGNSFPAQV